MKLSVGSGGLKQWVKNCSSALVSVSTFILFTSNPTDAQVIPDATLGAENSAVTEDFIRGILSDRISGGARRGSNLFHSFGQFDVPVGGGAYFDNPAGVENIFSRVTGGDRSEIFGRLGVLGDANLFFLNPNGILFGSTASLDVGGSFAATTANGIGFGERGLFSATSPDVPSPLLTINPSAFFYNQIVPDAAISIESINLGVPEGQNLLLMGGNVNINGVDDGSGLLYGIRTFADRVELGGIVEPGNIALNFSTEEITTLFPINTARGNVNFNERAGVVTLNDGDIFLTAHNVDLNNSSGVVAGGIDIPGLPAVRSGNVHINATGTITASNSSQIGSGVISGTGSGGDVSLRAREITLTNGSGIVTASAGSGTVGNILLEAEGDISLAGRAANGLSSGIVSGISPFFGVASSSNSGSINLEANNLILRDGAGIATTNFAQGNVGNITIDAEDSIEMANLSSISAATTGQGNAGNIFVGANNQINVRSGSRFITETSGQGNAGSITIQAGRAVTFDGIVNGIRTGISSSVQPLTSPANEDTSANSTLRRAGGVTIAVDNGSLIFSNDAILFSNVEAGAFGQAGDVLIRANSVALREGGQILALLRDEQRTDQNIIPGARGRGGNITFNVSGSITLTGRSASSTSGISTASLAGAEGRAGDIVVNSPILRLDNEAFITTSTANSGRAGNVTLDVGRLTIRGGAQVLTSTSGSGRGGNIRIENAELTALSGSPENRTRSALAAETRASGQAGRVRIDTARLIINNGAIISTGTFPESTGRGGNLFINASELIRLNGTSNNGNRAAIGAETRGEGRGGNIRIETPNLYILNGAIVSANATSESTGSGGNLTVYAADSVILDGTSPNNFRAALAAETQGTGRGGDIEIRTGELTIRDGALISVTAAGRASRRGGNLLINASDSVRIIGISTNGQFISALGAETEGSGRAGDITVNTSELIVQGGALISALAREDSQGSGGNLTINSRSVVLGDRARITAQSQGSGRAGNIAIAVEDHFEVENSEVTTAAANSSGGNIQINLAPSSENSVTILQSGDIRTNSREDGGNVAIGGLGLIAFEDSDIIASSENAAGGSITLTAPGVFFDGGNLAAIQQGVNQEAIAQDTSNGNGRVDVISTGRTQGGTINLPDVSLIENSLGELQQSSIDTENLIANSCIARTEQGGTFLVTGAEGLRDRPGDPFTSNYPLGTVRPLPDSAEPSSPPSSSRPWQLGDSIVEPQGVYQLADGRVVLSRDCLR